MSYLESTGSKPGTLLPPQGTAGCHDLGRRDSVSGIQCLQAKDVVQHPIMQRKACRGKPADHRIIRQKMSLVPEVREPAEGITGDIPRLPSYTLRRQSSPVSPFSLACALSHFLFLTMYSAYKLNKIFSKLHPAWQHRHICTAQCFFLQANPKHHDVYLTLTNVCFINGSEFGDLPGKDKWNLTVHSTELRTCA